MMALCFCFSVACKKQKIKIGLMADIDSLPIAYAYLQGWLPERIELEVFTSAPMRDSAFISKNLIGSVSDLISAVQLSDTGLDICTPITTGGSYALIKNASGLNTVAISSGTIIEYMCDTFASNYKKIIIASMAERCSMLLKNKVGAAVLPEPFAAYSVENGCSYVSQNNETHAGVMVFYRGFTSTTLFSDFCAAYDRAVQEIMQGADISSSMQFLGFPKVDASNLNLHFTPAAPPDKRSFDDIINYMRLNLQYTGDVKYAIICS